MVKKNSNGKDQESDTQVSSQELHSRMTKLENELERMKALINQMNRRMISSLQNEPIYTNQTKEFNQNYTSKAKMTSIPKRQRNTGQPKIQKPSRNNLSKKAGTKKQQNENKLQNKPQGSYPQHPVRRQQPLDDSVFNPFKYYRREQ
ncbi:hypothetical protein [Halobacillus sp. Marseille-Q1614]|uniref:hypothetical protein n=1 Tax=Halobacillus sp. Marseille-Q1614 TaxID=2709134 RepID=UPI00156F4074|nr:hypothetical protein [Halobacillus sp. Marseille-Q1614]